VGQLRVDGLGFGVGRLEEQRLSDRQAARARRGSEYALGPSGPAWAALPLADSPKRRTDLLEDRRQGVPDAVGSLSPRRVGAPLLRLFRLGIAGAFRQPSNRAALGLNSLVPRPDRSRESAPANRRRSASSNWLRSAERVLG